MISRLEMSCKTFKYENEVSILPHCAKRKRQVNMLGSVELLKAFVLLAALMLQLNFRFAERMK